MIRPSDVQIQVAGRLRGTLIYGPHIGSAGLLQNQNNISLATSHDSLLIDNQHSRGSIATCSNMSPSSCRLTLSNAMYRLLHHTER